MKWKPEPECHAATINGKSMHRSTVKLDTGECVFCSALRSAYARGYKDGEQK